MARRKDDWGWRRPPAARPIPDEERASYEVREPEEATQEAPAPEQPERVEPPPSNEPRSETHVEPAPAPLGHRRAALRTRRRKERTARILKALTAAIVLGAIAVTVVFLTVKNDPEPDDDVKVPVAGVDPVEAPANTVLFGTKERSGATSALWIVVLSYQPGDERGSVIYVPAHTAVEVPGRGLQGVGQAYASGGVPLLLVSLENLLGVQMDRYVELSDKDARVLFDAVGPLSVDVPEDIKVPAGPNQARLLIPSGQQQLSPEFLVRFLYTRGLDANDVALGSRQISFWHALFARFADDPGELERALERGGAALGESDGDVEEHAQLLRELLALPINDRLITTIPVSPVSAGESELYNTNKDDLAAFVSEAMAVPSERAPEIRVQILNGNGVPGIGQEVAELLVDEGFRVILSGNARRLNYRQTLIIAYGDSPDQIELAEKAKRLLGVGEVQVSVQQQGIVDLTIVVGKDFLRT